MTEMKISAVAVPWYKREDYARILEVMSDAHLLPPTFEKWEWRANQVIDQVKNSGSVPVKAHLEPDAFVAWCKGRGMDLDAKARIAFANHVAAAMYQQGRA